MSNILRSWDDAEKLAETGKLGNCYIFELSGMFVQFKITHFLPRFRTCALEECQKTFTPLRKDMIYCCRQHNVRAQSVKRQEKKWREKNVRRPNKP